MCVNWFIFVFFFENVSRYLLSFRVVLSKEQLGTLPFQCCFCSKELLIITNFYVQQIYVTLSRRSYYNIFLEVAQNKYLVSYFCSVTAKKKILELLVLKPSSICIIFIYTQASQCKQLENSDRNKKQNTKLLKAKQTVVSMI